MTIQPPFLKQGDTIAIISPSGVVEATLVFNAKEVLESWGYKVLLGHSYLAENGRFAGTDEQRIADIVWALTDENIHAVFCSRGGYGLIRLLDKIDWNKVVQSPKMIVGFSDITVLHNVCAQLGIYSVHSPMAKHLAIDALDSSSTYLRELLQGNVPNYSVEPHPFNRNGKVEGKLIGGNLSVLYGLRGTPYDLDYTDAILVLEDIGERAYHLDRMMYNLLLGGVFTQIKGLVVGQFSDIPTDESFPYSPYEIIQQVVSLYDFPVCYDFPVGHVKENFPLLLGAQYALTISSESTKLLPLC
ncbi:MAG: LD-carboxypeptidase [Paludibacteraceae bacterium]|nr:LD-carboxypeptidase [Paludibacteraceae bacterium]MBP6284280.1 LD-carboxypeptidase [Paludibacteraceae bacterium]